MTKPNVVVHSESCEYCLGFKKIRKILLKAIIDNQNTLKTIRELEEKCYNETEGKDL